MKTFGLLSATALVSSLLIAPRAYAQDDPIAAAATDPAQEAETAGGADIVVTGSRIVRPNLDSAVPVTSVAIEELTNTGDVSLGDALNELPSMRTTFSQATSIQFIGTAGLNLLDLRGLGTTRTLVLVNGRRHVNSSPGIPARVDVNSIPVDLVERVDVITGGNSAIYGSDAVAGVVNFVLKRDFEGIRVRGQAGISDEGDRGSQSMSITAGKNFAEGRGNVAVSAEYSFADDLYYTDRDDLYGAFSGRNQFQLSDDTLGEPAAGDGIFDFVFRSGIRNINISDGGAYGSTCPADTPANAARRALNCTGELSNTGAELGRVFVFDPNGNLVPNIPDIDFRTVGSGNGVGGLGSSLRLTGQLQPQLERKAANFLASYEVSEAFRPFIEAKYVRIDAIQEGQPTSIANLQGTYSLDNAFLSDQARNLLVQSLAPGATSFSIQRFNVDFGGRGEDVTREIYRIVGGIDGRFNDDWRYELALNYGRFEGRIEPQNRIHLARFRAAANAVRNPAGQIVCAINNDADTTNDDAACVPINVFGFGAPSPEALNYVTTEAFRDDRAEQFDATAFISGDLSQLFELPGGAVGFAIGAEYRRETASSIFDPVTASGATDQNVAPPFLPPALEVKEAFAELRIPLLADMPFANELTIEAAGRVSDYNAGGGSTGTVWTYNVGGVYAPVRDIRFRVGYAKSVRAPTQLDLFSPARQTFLNGLIDPCSQANINNGTANREANCAAAGVPTTEVINGATVPFTNVPASGIRGLNGSNPNLEAETGNSLTIGFVAQPRFVPGLTLTIDYYDITVDNVIFGLAPQTIIDLCYDSPSGIDNQYCANVFRRPDGTFRGQSNRQVGGTTVNYTVGANDNSFLSAPFNFARQETSGIDVDLGYHHEIAAGVDLNTRAIVSYLINRDNYTDINNPDFRDQQKFELGDPEWAAAFSADLDFGVFELGYKLRYVGKQTVDFFETQNEIDGRPPTDADRTERVFLPDVFYHNFRLGIEPEGSRFRFYAGVDNAFDTAPPFGLDGTGATGIIGGGAAIFDNIGRYFYAGAEVNF